MTARRIGCDGAVSTTKGVFMLDRCRNLAIAVIQQTWRQSKARDADRRMAKTRGQFVPHLTKQQKDERYLRGKDSCSDS